MSLKTLIEKAKTRLELNRGMEVFWNDLYRRKDIKKESEAFVNQKYVSVDDLKQWLEKLNERALEIDKPSNDYAEVCRQTRQYRTLLKDVLGLPLEGIK